MAVTWSDDADGGRGREISRDFASACECLLRNIWAVSKGVIVPASPRNEDRSGSEVTSVVIQTGCGIAKSKTSYIRWNYLHSV